jgi:hypothetical protein
VKGAGTMNAYAVGSLWRTSWGYDQTNVEHFEVVRETPGTVTLRRIASEVRDGRVYPQAGAYITDWSLMGNSTEWNGTEFVPAAQYERDKARGYSEKVCRKARGPYVSLRIDDVRYAWPTSVDEGSYDTLAAGQPGH